MHTDHKFSVTVLVDGLPSERTFASSEPVRAVIVELLSPHDRANADKYRLTDSTQQPPKELDPNLSLAQNGVQDGHVLSLTKKDGGGGQ